MYTLLKTFSLCIYYIFLYVFFFKQVLSFPNWPMKKSINLCFSFYFHSEYNTFLLDKCLLAQLSGIDIYSMEINGKTSFLYEMRETGLVLLTLLILSETSICICMTADMHTNSCKYLCSQLSSYSFYNFYKPLHFNIMESL